MTVGAPGVGTETCPPQAEHFKVRPASVAGAEKRLPHPWQANERLAALAEVIGGDLPDFRRWRGRRPVLL